MVAHQTVGLELLVAQHWPATRLRRYRPEAFLYEPAPRAGFHERATRWFDDLEIAAERQRDLLDRRSGFSERSFSKGH